MNQPTKVTPDHLRRDAYLYVRQSSLHQVHDNRESTARQYDLKRRAQALGWRGEQLVVIDEDQGRSGASADGRRGFQRLVADVGLGRAGLVMGLEVSRFARSSTDWHRLLEICALSDTLILDEDGLYDPSAFNDRLLLGLKGTMSEAELHVLKARLAGGALNKARRGELWIRPPVGLVAAKSGKLALDPDEQIQGAVRLLFETFRRTGSALAVVRHFSRNSILFPRRIFFGVRAGDVIFVPPQHSRILHVLHNPRYAGAYVFGRTKQRAGIGSAGVRFQRLPRDQWKVFLPGAFPGYISWDEFEVNQEKLRANAQAYTNDRRKSPPREGAALLQGLVVCGRCGKRMTVRYHVQHGRPIPTYVCQQNSTARAGALCQTIAGTGLDDAVGDAVLGAVNPTALDVAFQVFEELRQRKGEIDRQRRAQVDRAREEAEAAQRQFMLVRPENRLVADNLERLWNETLQRLQSTEEEYSRATRTDAPALAAEEKTRILSLATDLPRVWKDARTPTRERKRMLRLLLEDVTLVRNAVIRVQIRWKGGATSTLEHAVPKSSPDLRRTPTAVVEQIRALATERTDHQIAETLNNRGLRSGTGVSFTRGVVAHLRITYGITSYARRLRNLGWLTSAEMAVRLGVHLQTAKKYANAGIMNAVRANDKGDIFFEPTTGPLPQPHRGIRHRARARYPQLATHRPNGVQSDA